MRNCSFYARRSYDQYHGAHALHRQESDTGTDSARRRGAGRHDQRIAGGADAQPDHGIDRIGLADLFARGRSAAARQLLRHADQRGHGASEHQEDMTYSTSTKAFKWEGVPEMKRLFARMAEQIGPDGMGEARHELKDALMPAA